MAPSKSHHSSVGNLLDSIGPSPASSSRTGAYPGSFNPPTLAHLAIAAAARQQRELDRIDLVLSRRALAKEEVDHPRFTDRVAVVTESVAHLDWINVVVTDAQLLVDIAAGYDVIVMGADKWVQINDPRWYNDSLTRRDEAIAALPELAIAPRPPLHIPASFELQLDAAYATMSSTLARGGAIELMTQAARRFASETGAWLDPQRYELDRC